jgi:hypothetical protein
MVRKLDLSMVEAVMEGVKGLIPFGKTREMPKNQNETSIGDGNMSFGINGQMRSRSVP